MKTQIEPKASEFVKNLGECTFHHNEDMTEIIVRAPEGKKIGLTMSRLMKESPKLLEALQGLWNYAAQEIGLPAEECTAGHFAQARAAIAKAEGRK